MLIKSRRSFLFGAGATLVAAPAIVRVASNLMPVSTRFQFSTDQLYLIGHPPMVAAADLGEPASIISGMVTFIRDGSGMLFRPAFEILPRHT